MRGTACPLKSDVIYFSADGSLHDEIVDHTCQNTGTCTTVLNQWIGSGSVITQVEPMWSCESGLDNCDSYPLDRRQGKLFYAADDPDALFTPIRATVEDAFRYKTRFVSRSGSNLGFTPSICEAFSDTTPYCYDPAAIEGLRERTDCLLSIYATFYSDPSGPSDTRLFNYLEENFSLRTVPNPQGGLPTNYDGFEKLFAELVIMLGDDAYTAAFESRFDLAGLGTAGFEGGPL